jgi:hypothetical protein
MTVRGRKRCLVLPAIHFGLCIWMAFSLLNSRTENWGWFPIFLIDLPFSVLLLRLANLGSSFNKYGEQAYSLLVFGLGGSAWWLLINVVLVKLVSKAEHGFRRDSQSDSGR